MLLAQLFLPVLYLGSSIASIRTVDLQALADKQGGRKKRALQHRLLETLSPLCNKMLAAPKWFWFIFLKINFKVITLNSPHKSSILKVTREIKVNKSRWGNSHYCLPQTAGIKQTISTSDHSPLSLTSFWGLWLGVPWEPRVRSEALVRIVQCQCWLSRLLG